MIARPSMTLSTRNKRDMPSVELAKAKLESLEQKVKNLRMKFEAGELERKSERQKKKKARDYEIFTEMPYKLSSRKYSLGERHPVSKKRFEATKAVLDENLTYNRADNQDAAIKTTGAKVASLQRLLEIKTKKESFIRVPKQMYTQI